MIRQLNPGNYPNSGNISAEFENLIRYLRSAERGSLTIGDIISRLVDESGTPRIPFTLRFDPTSGLEVKNGDSWEGIVPADELRGPPGLDLGLIDGPIFYNRRDFTLPSLASEVSYPVPELGDVVVYRNGALESPSAYTKDVVGRRVVFAQPLEGEHRVTITSVRITDASNYTRVDSVVEAPQVIFNIQWQSGDEIQVFKNGLLQREGIQADFVLNTDFGYINFNTPVQPGTVITTIRVRPSASRRVLGLMTEDAFTGEDGLIRLSKINIPNDGIEQEKVAGLPVMISRKANFFIGDTTPLREEVIPTELNLWLDKSGSISVLRFWDGAQWLQTSPDTGLPQALKDNARQYVRVNATGSGYELGEVDLSGQIPRTWRGAANGVASLDADGLLPEAQVPPMWVPSIINREVVGAVSNGNVFAARVSGFKLRIIGLSARVSTGTCTVRVMVDGTPALNEVPVSANSGDTTFAQVIEIDGTISSKRVEIAIGSVASSPANLQLSLSVTILGGAL